MIEARGIPKGSASARRAGHRGWIVNNIVSSSTSEPAFPVALLQLSVTSRIRYKRLHCDTLPLECSPIRETRAPIPAPGLPTGGSNGRLLPSLGQVLFVAHLFHPFNDFAVELFLNGDVRHGSGRRRAMPVLLARREPDHVSRPDFLDRAALALRPSAARRHDQRLPQRMRVPCGASARLKGDARAGGAGGRDPPERADQCAPCR